MLEHVSKQALWGRKRLLLATGVLLLGILITVWTAATDILAPYGPWRPMNNPDAYRIRSAAEADVGFRNVYVTLEALPLYGTGYEVGEGQDALAVCLASRDGFWIPVLTDTEVYDKMDWYGVVSDWAGEFRWMKNRALENEILTALEEEFGFPEEEFLPIVLEPSPIRLLWLEDGILLLAGLILELVGLRILLGKMDFRFSPGRKSLSFYGPPDAVAAVLEEELTRCGIESPLFTENWMIIRQGWKGTIFVPFGDVVWCHIAAAVKTSAITRYHVVLYLKSRRQPLIWQLPGRVQAEAVLSRIHEIYPSMDTRYFPQWEQLWKQNRSFFLAFPPCRK